MSSTSIYSSPLCSCIICRAVKSAKGIHSHYVCSHTEEGKEKHKNNSLIRSLKFAELNKNNPSAYCVECKSLLDVGKRKNKFCSKSCAAKYNNLKRDYSKFKPGPKPNCVQKYIKPKYTKISICSQCKKYFKAQGRKTCSVECLKLAMKRGGHNSQGGCVRRSKDEIKLYDLLLPYFYHVEHNQPIFNGWDADIIIHNTRTAILWNGPWHYQNMPGLKHSLKQVQNRDRIKKKEIENAGWICLVFEDRYFSPAAAFDVILSRYLDSN